MENINSISIKEFPKYKSIYDNSIKKASIFLDIHFKTNVGKELSTHLISISNDMIDRKKSLDEIEGRIGSIEKSIELEAGIFEYSLVYKSVKNYPEEMILGIYRDKLYDILLNLDKRSSVENSYLRKKILSGDFDPQSVPFMSASQIHPEKWETLEKKKRLREYKKSHMAATDLYTCYKCGESKCKITQMQTRGADEPITNFITCLVCHNTFKK